MDISQQTQSQKRIPQGMQEALSTVDALIDAGMPPQPFLDEFTQCIAGGINALGVVIWMADAQGHLRMASEVRWGQLGIVENPEHNQNNGQLVGQVAGAGQALFIDDKSKYAEQLPGAYTLLLVPILGDAGTQGVIEVFLPPVVPQEDRKDLFHYTEQMAGYASIYLAAQESEFLAIDAPGFWNRYESFLLELHNSLNSKLAANTAANEARMMLGVDRVSIASYSGRALKIIAVSGQDAINRRGNVVRLLSQLTKVILPSEEDFLYDNHEQQRAPQVEKILGDYLKESASKMILIIPLFAIRRRDELRDKPKHPNARKASPEKKVVGALIVEKMNSSRIDVAQQDLSHLLADHIGTALGNAKSHEEIFLLPVWRTLGKSWAWLRTRPLWKTTSILTLITLITCLMIFLPWSYRVEGTGRLMPVVQREVFAPEVGKIKTIFVKSGEMVEAGQPLVLLTNPKLEGDWSQMVSMLSQKRLQQDTMQQKWEFAYNNNRKDEANEAEGQIERLKVEIKNLIKEEARLHQQVNSLTVRSPITGVVATFQVQQVLRDRPINRGDVLLEVMDPNGKWHLELNIDDKRMGHILEARKRSESQTLPVEFILATDPETTLQGKMTKIHSRTNVFENEGNRVEIFVTPLENESLPQQRIGAEVKARIDCGKKKLGYVLFGDVVDFIRIRLWL